MKENRIKIKITNNKFEIRTRVLNLPFKAIVFLKIYQLPNLYGEWVLTTEWGLI